MKPAGGCVLLVVLFVVLYIIGVSVTQFAYNGIALALNWPLLSWWQTAAACFILSVIGGYFKNTATK